MESKIDLEKFTEEKDIIIPIVNNVGKFQSRKFTFPNIKDGWYNVRAGSNYEVKDEATPLQIEKIFEELKRYVGYPIGTDAVPINFDNFFRKGEGETVKILFLNESPWEIVSFIEWGDGNYYSAGVNIGADRSVINEIKGAFEKELPINEVKGATPELKYYFLLHNLHRDTLRTVEAIERLKLKEQERKKRIDEFKQTFPGRLENTIKNAGGKLVRFYKRGNGYTVVWKVAGQKITSRIKNDYGIIDLGFCASGEDKKHSLSSAIQLAKLYYKEGSLGEGGLYITRG